MAVTKFMTEIRKTTSCHGKSINIHPAYLGS
jgi:hypothetical protein